MIYLLYIVFGKINGETEAFLYSRKGADALPENEHIWFVSERVLVAIFALAGVVYGFLFDPSTIVAMGITEGIAAMLAYSFFRDWFYYKMRDRIDGTQFGAKHQSPTDTAQIKFNYVRRRNMFYISLAVLLVGYGGWYLLTGVI